VLRPYGKIVKNHTIPYGALVDVSVELRNAHYSSGYKNDEWLPELPCPPQDDKQVCLEEELYRKEISEIVKKILDPWNDKGILTRREAKVLQLRFGIYTDHECTLDEIGQMFNLTRERIRQIESKAKRRLKHPSIGLREVFDPDGWYKTTIKKIENIKEKNI
jgi:RNA polymerase sigma factor (sigma-70 family)